MTMAQKDLHEIDLQQVLLAKVFLFYIFKIPFDASNIQRRS